ncbi:hypothetical protein JNB_12149 [Janibacter sp. HTCC2649]|nr:hypothetical protein JNB_12149 [Janibacter sp. HTCC2649]
MPEPRTASFSMVDVFASRPLTGNPAAVVPDADGLSLAQMQALAREFNQSETVFIVAADGDRADWQFRSFTPIGAEVGGAGHNALAACLWLVDRRLPRDRTEFVVQIGADLLRTGVTRPADGPAIVSVQQSPPEFGAVLTDPDLLADALGLTPADFTEDDIQVISTGAGHLLVPLVDRGAVDRARPDTRRLAAVLKTVAGEGCYLYSLDTVEGDSAAYARFFNPRWGSRKIRRPERQPVHWSPSSWPRAASPPAPSPSWSRATLWAAPAGSSSRWTVRMCGSVGPG